MFWSDEVTFRRRSFRYQLSASILAEDLFFDAISLAYYATDLLQLAMLTMSISEISRHIPNYPKYFSAWSMPP